MGYIALSAYLLIGCGPAFVFFGTRVAHRAFLVVLTFTSCATWILCALLLALPCIRFLPLGSSWAYVATVTVYATTHEVFRRLMWLMQMKWTTEALEKIARHFGYKRVSICDKMNMSLAWGFGQGIARSIFFFTSNAFLAIGPGTYYVDTCPTIPLHLTTALTSLAFVAIHTSMILIDNFSNQEHLSYVQYTCTHGSHLFACFLTLGNLYFGGCIVVLPCLLALSMLMMSCAASLFLSKATR